MLTFITGNINKARQVAHLLKYPIRHEQLDVDEIQSLDLEKIIRHKAEEAYKILCTPVLVDDVSLIFTAWGRLPGPFIRWFIDDMGTAGICRMLDGYPDRSATATVMFALRHKRGIKVFSAGINGQIASHPRGGGGFGWNPIFIPEGYAKTWAELTTAEQDRLPFRQAALARLDTYLTRHRI